MTPDAIGRALCALRQRKGWRQVDLAARVGVSQSAVSAAECGDLDAVSVRTLGRLLAECGGDLVVAVRWRGGELDRLLDRAHAELVERAARLLARLGWDVHVEVSFARYGERGSVDILGWHRAERILLIIEVKSEITGVEETLRRHDVKVRLAPHIAFERLGERPAHVARLLVLPDTSVTRRRIAEHDATFRHAYPARGRSVSRWLAAPDGPLAGILLLRSQTGGPGRRRRVRPAPGEP
ncbi:MAG TPA: XRE family transcriptional regulator [Candidatus Limnocylindrales bacterium]|nr:XRE family transcriptional regulator [Candidatus Limnocylindrales bacterium]